MLNGKRCLVTGGGGEIGAALCRGLTDAGARVAVADIDKDKAARTAEGLDGAHALSLDVTDANGWARAMDTVQTAFGGLDVLINCAGVFCDKADTIADIAPEDWRMAHAVNLDGAFLGIRAATQVMQPGSAILNIGSVVGYFGARSGMVYGTSKAAIRGLTVQAAAACIAEGNGIRVNALHPGYVLTGSALASGIAQLGSRDAAETAFATRSPMRRTMRPDDLIGPAVFLCSDAAARMNGAEMLVDDGLATQMPGQSFTG